MVSQAIAPQNAKNRPFVLKKGISHLSDLADGGGVFGYPGDYYGRIYYVNNITGNSSYDGLSWDTPFDEVSTAITASETYRALPSGSTNDYQRNIIFIQGTGTAYTKLTALPSYCDMIGIGADVRGNGSGIARIGSDANTTPASGVDADAVRGLYMQGLQFQAGSGYAAFDCDDIFRSKFVDCAFMGNGGGALAPSAGLTWKRASGLVVDGCHWGSASGSGGAFDIGIHVSGTHFHNTIIRNCHITGVVGIQIDVACTSPYFSDVHDNYIGSGFDECTLSVDDNSGQSHVVFRNNQLATNGTLLANGAGRWINNWITNGVAPVAVTAT